MTILPCLAQAAAEPAATAAAAAPSAAPAPAATPAAVTEQIVDTTAAIATNGIGFVSTCLNWLQAHIGDIIVLLVSLLVLQLILKLADRTASKLHKAAEKKAESLNLLVIDLLEAVAKCVIWAIGLLFIAQNSFGLDVSTLIAGAGVCSLAVAFAAQNTIANIFGVISLILDKPFALGDRIVANGRDGIVEAVGLRSTRLRGLDGTVHIIPNKELSECAIQNITRKPNFKEVYSIGLVYSSTPEQIQKGIDILTDIFASSKLIDQKGQPARIGFAEMRDWSLNISVIAWFQTADFFELCAEKSRINFEILKRFNAAGLEFAFPSQSLYLAGDPARPVEIKR